MFFLSFFFRFQNTVSFVRNTDYMKERLLLKSLLNDLIGKDSQRGITLTYGWLANQVGHFALAFIPTTVAMQYFEKAWLCALCTGGAWTLFETVNFLSPLFKGLGKTGNRFPIEWKNIAFDTSTDVFFFWLGAYSAYLLSEESYARSPFIVLVMLIYLAFVTRKWYKVKFLQQRCGFPFQIRLSQWKGKLNTAQRDEIIRFKQKGKDIRHFLILGAVGSGKTSLMVGLGNEMAIRGKNVRYTTFFKWIAEWSKAGAVDANHRDIWDWKEADFFILDDINPGKPTFANLYSAAMIRELIQASQDPTIANHLKKQSVAWLIGEMKQDDTLENWCSFLEDLGVERSAIKVLHLPQKS